MVSSRFPPNLTANAVTRALEARLAAGRPVLDLTETNPTRVGLLYPPTLLAPLADPAALLYDPQPLGHPAARAAVAAEFARQGTVVPPERITLTSSTSEAYALLFKLCCDPGDEVLVPQPSYPLFDHLTRLEGVTARPYPLEYHGTWRIDTDALRALVSSRCRALLVVSPNNPTGSYLHGDDLAALVRLCAEHDLVLIGDEVFFDYPLDPAPHAVSVLAQHDVVTVALGGLSKSGGLPQVKLGWMAWSGPADRLTPMLQAYEIMADSYLSVSTPVQVAAPRLLHDVMPIRQHIHARVRDNLRQLRAICADWPALTPLPVEGGWSAVVQVPAIRSEEALTLALLEQDGVLVHPGYFFDFPREAFVVVSLLPAPDVFAAAVRRLAAHATGPWA